MNAVENVISTANGYTGLHPPVVNVGGIDALRSCMNDIHYFSLSLSLSYGMGRLRTDAFKREQCS